MFSAILKTAFTGKFPSSTAGLHLVMSISCLRKKSRLVRYRMVECFHLITINAKHLYFRCEQLLFFLREINRFLETLSSFCLFEKALFLETRDSRLETRSSNVSSIEARGSSLEFRVSSVNLLLSGTVRAFELIDTFANISRQVRKVYLVPLIYNIITDIMDLFMQRFYVY